MYALAINGSPRKGGNTEHLLRAVLSELKDVGWETELVKIGGNRIIFQYILTKLIWQKKSRNRP